MAGSIPACAGKPRRRSAPATSRRVHPRVCGEATLVILSSRGHPGPSPRVRGSLTRPPEGRRGRGSIPACAGKPAPPITIWRVRRVHPRVCGEASTRAGSPRATPGPSPRVRGSPICIGALAGVRGSIPACAGKPFNQLIWIEPDKVHPRVCGEASKCTMRRVRRAGPSPRVRGSPQHLARRPRGDGSIPACAGKPPGRRRVHPRVCGEASMLVCRMRIQWGPSPRVRGSRGDPAAVAVLVGSIPACAGKPSSCICFPFIRRVHPRVCGEADSPVVSWTGGRGPSPRVRGSLPPRTRRDLRRGSIPACAGKPGLTAIKSADSRVHPRVCGEAL